MAVAFGTSASAAAQDSDTLTIPKPTSLAENEYMVAFVMNRGSGTWNTPSGWTAKGTFSISANRGACFVKKASAADAAASDFSFTGAGASSESAGWIMRLTGTFTDGMNVVFQVDNTDATPDANDAFVFTTSLTPNANGFLVFACGAEAANANSSTSATASIATSSPTITQRAFQGQPNGDDLVVVGLTGQRPEATAIGDTTVDFNSTGNLSNAGVIVLAIYETVNASVSPAVVSLVGTIPAPAVSGGATVSPAVVTMTASVVDPTVTTPANKWVNPDKSSAPTWDNPAKT